MCVEQCLLKAALQVTVLHA